MLGIFEKLKNRFTVLKHIEVWSLDIKYWNYKRKERAHIPTGLMWICSFGFILYGQKLSQSTKYIANELLGEKVSMDVLHFFASWAWGTNCPLFWTTFQMLLYSEYPWEIEIVSSSRVEGRHDTTHLYIKDSGSPGSQFFCKATYCMHCSVENEAWGTSTRKCW